MLATCYTLWILLAFLVPFCHSVDLPVLFLLAFLRLSRIMFRIMSVLLQRHKANLKISTTGSLFTHRETGGGVYLFCMFHRKLEILSFIEYYISTLAKVI